jgi:hypothetical protein
MELAEIELTHARFDLRAIAHDDPDQAVRPRHLFCGPVHIVRLERLGLGVPPLTFSAATIPLKLFDWGSGR